MGICHTPGKEPFVWVDDDDDDDDDDDYDVLYSAVTPCYYSMLCALGRIESFEVCRQWAHYLVCKSIDKTDR